MDDIEINLSIKWKKLDIDKEVVLLEQANVVDTYKLTTGTGINQINSTFYTSGNLNSGYQRFDLFNLERRIFGQKLITNYSGANIKFLYIKNNSPYKMFLAGTGTNGFADMLGWSYLGHFIAPHSHFLSFDFISGYKVSNSQRYFYLSGIQYELGLLAVI